ncbi:MAG: C40 family peptidase [Ruminiclostridium sp.]|nr:C40 family peptidase [Ruminiclostridium sp.]
MKFSKRLFCAFMALVLLVSCFSITAAAKGDIKFGVAFTTGSNLRLRSKANTSSKILDTAAKDEVVVVLNKTGKWYKVIYNLQEGYMHSDYLEVIKKENVELGYGKVNGTSVNVRKGAGTSYASVGQANTGDKAYIIGINNGWYKVLLNEQICYIRSDFLDLTEIPYENKDSKNAPVFFKGGKSTGVAVSAKALEAAEKGELVKPEKTEEPKEEEVVEVSKGDQIVAKAKTCLGVPYVWGGQSKKGFDCSGLVYYVLKNLGYSPSRSTSEQYKMGSSVSKSKLQPGDLVFFAGTYKSGISHVGIYIGDGKFIHAPSSGDVVKISDLSNSYYKSHYYGARRIG